MYPDKSVKVEDKIENPTTYLSQLYNTVTEYELYKFCQRSETRDFQLATGLDFNQKERKL